MQDYGGGGGNGPPGKLDALRLLLKHFGTEAEPY